MLRVKLPGGLLTPHRLRTIGRISQDLGGDYGELTTRQNIRLHGMKLNDLPEIFATLKQAGLSTSGGCGDTVRNITGCPVAGLAADELFNAFRSSRRPQTSSMATPITATCRASTRSPYPDALTSATHPKSTASA